MVVAAQGASPDSTTAFAPVPGSQADATQSPGLALDVASYVNGAPLSLSTVSDGAVRIAGLDDLADALGRNARLTDLRTDGDGWAGLTEAGLLTYRPAPDFAGVETLRLEFKTSGKASTTVEIAVSVSPGRVALGWAEGEHYVLARDEDGWSIAEPGREHRLVHVSPEGDPAADGLTRQTAITPQALKPLLETLREAPGKGKDAFAAASWHVLFERGHDYRDFAPAYVSGEDPLHPFVIGAYGQGARPLFGRDLRFWASDENILVRDIAFGLSEEPQDRKTSLRGIDMLGWGHENIMFENVVVSPVNASPRIQSDSSNITVYRSSFLDAHQSEPARADWSNTYKDRLQGLYTTKVDALLIAESLADHNGWQEGYRSDGGYSNSQPPSKYNQNFYINFSVSNLTFVDNISSNAASFGAQLRPGGVMDGNVFFANNAAFNLTAGEPDGNGGFLGNRGLAIDTVATAPSSKDALQIGARGYGGLLIGEGLGADLIVAQDGDGLGFGPGGVTRALKNGGYETEGNTIFNWGSEPDETPYATASEAALLGVSIAGFARVALSPIAGAADLVDALRARDRDNWTSTPDAEDIVAYFRAGFGYDSLASTPGRIVTFEGDPRAEGFRWDNRFNWTDDRGPISGDDVRLDGHAVTFGLDTLELRALDLGAGGVLRVTQGLVEVTGSGALEAGVLGGAVEVSSAGQFVFNGHDDGDVLKLSVEGGRAVNAGVAKGALDVEIKDGQLILAEGADSFILRRGSKLTMRGEDGAIGFDGPGGSALLRVAGGTLAFIAGPDGVSTIEEFGSGRHGADAPGIHSVIDLRGGALEVDLSDYDPANGLALRLVDVDRGKGGFNRLDAIVTGTPVGYDAVFDFDKRAGDLDVMLIPF